MGWLLRIAAVTAAAFVALSFLLFALDQSGEGSATQVKAIDGPEKAVASDTSVDRPAPERRIEKLREARHDRVREDIDDVNDVLVTPFTGLIGSRSVWAERMVSAAVALLLYGLGGMLLANFLPKHTRRQTDWREAT